MPSQSTDSRSIGTTGRIHDWPEKLAEIRAVTEKPVWVSEVGVSVVRRRGGPGIRPQADGGSFDAALTGRIHWYSLLRFAEEWPATTRHREAEGSSYYRHFYMGLVRQDAVPKKAFHAFRELHSSRRNLPMVSFRRSAFG